MKKTFEIGFKLYYGETSEWGIETLRAATKEEALREFARRKRIEESKLTPFRNWRWGEGVWSASLRYVKEVKHVACPH